MEKIVQGLVGMFGMVHVVRQPGGDDRAAVDGQHRQGGWLG